METKQTSKTLLGYIAIGIDQLIGTNQILTNPIFRLSSKTLEDIKAQVHYAYHMYYSSKIYITTPECHEGEAHTEDPLYTFSHSDQNLPTIRTYIRILPIYLEDLTIELGSLINYTHFYYTFAINLVTYDNSYKVYPSIPYTGITANSLPQAMQSVHNSANANYDMDLIFTKGINAPSSSIPYHEFIITDRTIHIFYIHIYRWEFEDRIHLK